MLVNLRALLARLIDIVLLRGGPESLPASPTLLALVVALNVIVTAVCLAFMPAAPASWLSQLVVATLITLVWFKVAFALTRKPERLLQTCTAIFGTTTFFLPALIPMTLALLPFVESRDPTVAPPAALSLLTFGLSLWLVIVQVRIVRAALEWPIWAVIVFFIGLNLAAALVYGLLFGVPLAKV
jgi:hypothetical protein